MINIFLPFERHLAQQAINDEIAGIYGQNLLSELSQLIKYYEVYDKGSDFQAEGANDYTPADLKYKTARRLINKEARFLFSKPPDFFIDVPLETNSKETTNKDSTILLKLLQNVLSKSSFNKRLVAAARDCFIAKRVAAVINVNEIDGISVNFLPALEFVFQTDVNNIDKLTKLVCFYTIADAKSKYEQRIYRKKYWLENGFCYISEEIRNGSNQVVEVITKSHKTRFTYIPAVVITNDGLTGDIQGESEIEQLEQIESWFSRLANADMDAQRKSMNPVKYTVDMSGESLENLSQSAGSFWDLQSSQDIGDGNSASSGKVGTLESAMLYSPALTTTLNRMRSAMHEELDVPDVSPEALKGVVSSGKTLKAIYWGLIVRCDEKMLTWRPALEFIAKAVIDSAVLYPNAAKKHISDTIPNVEYVVKVDNQYPLPEDETEEKQMDVVEIGNKARSVKSYLIKWRGMTSAAADEELRQIVLERQMLEDSFSGEM